MSEESPDNKSDVFIGYSFFLLDMDVLEGKEPPFCVALVGVLNYEVDEGFFVEESFSCLISVMFLGKYYKSASLICY